MRRILFFFLDGVGLGEANPACNPFAAVELPTMERLLGGRRLVAEAAPLVTEQASLLALDACLGVEGLPQSATGQAALLTGLNAPGLLGYHYGPKPNPGVAEIIGNGNLFRKLKEARLRVRYLNAFPPVYFKAIESKRRLHGAIALAAAHAQVRFGTAEDLRQGQAVSADFTAQGWRERLGFADTPIITPREAGERLGRLAAQADFSLFECWLTDYAGHAQEMAAAGALLAEFDQVLDGLVSGWDSREGLIVITSDHGNLEDVCTRRHTRNPVPVLLIGSPELRGAFAEGLKDLTGVAPAIIRMLVEAER
jgi:hypothetical protein